MCVCLPVDGDCDGDEEMDGRIPSSALRRLARVWKEEGRAVFAALESVLRRSRDIVVGLAVGLVIMIVIVIVIAALMVLMMLMMLTLMLIIVAGECKCHVTVVLIFSLTIAIITTTTTTKCYTTIIQQQHHHQQHHQQQ